MDKIEEIMAIADEKKRKQALVQLAEKLRISTKKVRNDQGEINEGELVVKIYDVQQNARTAKFQNVGFLVVGFFLAVVAILSFLLIGRFFRVETF